MVEAVRRLTVGLDASGRSRLVTEEQLKRLDGTDIELWQSYAADSAVGLSRAVPFYPPAGGTLLRLVTLPSPDPSLTEADLARLADDFFAGNAIEDCRIDTTRHPMMHRTPTNDSVVLLQGRVRLLLDEGAPIDLAPFDVVNQRFTNHCWINLGPGPAVFLALIARDDNAFPQAG